MTDLASATFGGEIIFATDEWFAPARRLLLEDEPVFNSDFTAFGKWMDGWESRRKRIAGHDWAIIRLGLTGRIHGVELDTAFFTGNQAPRFSLQAAWIPEECVTMSMLARAWTRERMGSDANASEMSMATSLATDEWETLVPMTALGPGYEEQRRHFFSISDRNRYTHLRLNIFPDGGVARLRVHGVVSRDWESLPMGTEVDLIAVENGGTAIACSNRHYGEPKNMIKPGRGINMSDGWETARKPDRPAILEVGADGLVKAPGGDWAVLKLGVIGEITRVVVDTNHFKGNFPESISIHACLAPDARRGEFLDDTGGQALPWRLLLPRQKAQANREHVYKLSEGQLQRLGAVSHLKLAIMPDGGVMRLRAYGEVRPRPRL